MPQKKITELQLRSGVTDDLSMPTDDGIQSYRITALQFFNYLLTKLPNSITNAMLQSASVTDAKTSFTPPTISRVGFAFKSGGFSANATGVYTPPVGCKYIEVHMIGAGGGGAGSGSYANGGTAGANATFGTSLLTAGGGAGGQMGSGGGAQAVGGTFTVNSPAIDIGSTVGGSGGGAAGGGGAPPGYTPGGYGGTGLNGQSTAAVGVSSNAAQVNSGAGGSGAGSGANAAWAGGGGGAGAQVRALIVPTGTYAYSAPDGGVGGGAGTNGGAGGKGGSAQIIIKEFYQ